MLKVVCKHLFVEDEEFVIIKDENELYNNHQENNHVYYGTIPMVDIDENGYLKRRLNGAEMAIEDSISKAIESRKRHIKARKWKQRHPEASEIDLARYILSLIEE